MPSSFNNLLTSGLRCSAIPTGQLPNSGHEILLSSKLACLHSIWSFV